MEPVTGSNFLGTRGARLTGLPRVTLPATAPHDSWGGAGTLSTSGAGVGLFGVPQFRSIADADGSCGTRWQSDFTGVIGHQ
jgi:hypothetical protein